MNAIPFQLMNLDRTAKVDRAEVYPTSWSYDPLTQTTDLLLMGKSSPTTRSPIDSTGIVSSDSDESNDDTGED